MIDRNDVYVPATCLPEQREHYISRFLAATKHTGNLMLFAGDQKIEHLNEDFSGQEVHSDDNDPEHLFRISSLADVGVFAAQHGMISRYAQSYPDIRYLVKMNSKTHLVPTQQAEPVSRSLVDFSDVLDLRDSGVDVVGIGYTIYLGSEHESFMLSEAGRLIAQAHRHGLLAVLWIYPRGKAVSNETDPSLIAGAAGVACSLGADFVKVSAPSIDEDKDAHLLEPAIKAAGRTGVIASGGGAISPEEFLRRTADQIRVGARGSATGRNIHQHELSVAVKIAKALTALMSGGSYDEAVQIFNSP